MAMTDFVEHVESPTARRLEEIIGIFPDNNLKARRVSNLRKAKYIITAKRGPEIIGVLFIRYILSIPNATWIVKENYRRQGVAFTLLRHAQKDCHCITAISRNEASLNLAKKSGFLIFPCGIGIWFRGRKQ